MSKSRLQGAAVKLQSRGGKLRYELAQRLELASLFDGSVIGDGICSFCIESIVVRMNKKVVSGSSTLPFWPNDDEQITQFCGPFRIPTASSYSCCCSSSTTTTAKSANSAGFHSLHIIAHVFSPRPPPLFQEVHGTTISGHAHFNVGERDITVYGSQSSARAGTSRFILYSSILPKLSMTSSTPRLT